MAPNLTSRSVHFKLDEPTANTLRNKDKETMESTQQADYYRDGLGSRAPLDTNNLNEKEEKLIHEGVCYDQIVCQVSNLN